jgi:hypothetical protein
MNKDHTDLDDRMVELEQRLADVERGSRYRERARSRFARVVPPEAMTHFRSAGREQLLGIRTIVDHWIARIDSADEQAHPVEREVIEVR